MRAVPHPVAPTAHRTRTSLTGHPLDCKPAAYHEAGHAVLAHVFGRTLLAVSIASDTSTAGYTVCAIGWHPCAADDPVGRHGPLGPDSRSRLRERAIIPLAGAIAAYLAGGNPAAGGCGEGMQVDRALELAALAAPTQDQADEYVSEAGLAAAVLLREYWPAVKALAATLAAGRSGSTDHPRPHRSRPASNPARSAGYTALGGGYHLGRHRDNRAYRQRPWLRLHQR